MADFHTKYSILVFDSNILLLGIDFNLFKETIYSTPNIIKEVDIKKYRKKNMNIMHKIQAAIDSGKLILKEPSERYIKIVENKSKITGDFKALSFQDIGLIALTLELLETYNKEVILYTNDYSIENVCKELNIEFSPLYKKGIEKKIIFEIYCPYCKTLYQSEALYKICEVCGSKLKRRPKNSETEI